MNRYLVIAFAMSTISAAGFLTAYFTKPIKEVKISLKIADVEYTIPNGPGTFTFYPVDCIKKIELIKE